MKFQAILLASIVILGCGEKPSRGESKMAEKRNVFYFSDVSEKSGLGGYLHENGAFGEKWFPEPMGPGCGFIDYDGDGWEDILLVTGGRFRGLGKKQVPAIRLMRNNTDGTFSDVSNEVGLSNVFTYPFGIAAADFDNDGDQDFLLTTLYENLLFKNTSGYFTEVGSESGLSTEHGLSTSPIFFDADRDGHLDLYVGNYTDWSPDTDVWCTFRGEKGYCTPEVYKGTPSRFYQNNGDGSFTDRTSEAGFLPAPGKTLGVAEYDYDKDGWPDLIVANDLERDLLYENNQDGTFTEKGMIKGMAFDAMGRARAGMGVDVGLVDRSDEITIFVGNFQNEMFSVYRYSPEGFFTDFAAISKLGRQSLRVLTFGLFLFDVELDGDLDLLAANGHIQVEVESENNEFQFKQLAQLFLNDGDGVFDLFKGNEGSVLRKPIVGRGSAYADYDKDGDLDVLITENAGPTHLWRNDFSEHPETNANNYLRVKLEGSSSNRDGIGSMIELFIGNRKFSRRVRTGSSYLSQSEKVVTFGIGEAGSVDSLVIQWPSGVIDSFSQVAPNQELLIFEGETL